MAALKVLHINEYLSPKGGVETYLLSLLPMLDDIGLVSVLAYGEGDSKLFKSSRSLPVIRKLGLTGQKEAKTQMSQLIRKEKPDILHLHSTQSLGVLEACVEYGPLVMTAHDYRFLCPANTFFYKRTQEECHRTCSINCFGITLRKHCLTPRPSYAAYFYHRVAWMQKNMHRVTHMIAPSESARNRLLKAGFSSNRISVLPYFCPITPAAAPRPLPKNKAITFIGRIAPSKGQDYFIQALGLLPDAVRGILVGNIDDETRKDLSSAAERAGCLHRLEMRAWATRDEVQEILDRTSIFIFPSLWPETLGIVGLEALARGVPVVASDIGGVREWLKDGENGFLVPTKNVEKLRDAILKILESEETNLRMGRHGIGTIMSKFLPKQHTEQLCKIYREITSPRHRTTIEARVRET